MDSVRRNSEPEPPPLLHCVSRLLSAISLNQTPSMNDLRSSRLARRDFLRATLLAGSAAALTAPGRLFSAPVAAIPPVAIFSKVYQELNLDFAAGAAITAEAGLDGIDCPARPGGEVLPERATEDLPRYAEALAKHQRKILLLTTAILSVDTPHAETVLRAAKKLGVKYYRLGYWSYQKNQPPPARLNEIKAQLKDLAALNKELGLCGVLQNHTGKDMVGAKVRDYWEIVRGFDPAQIAVAFDLGHALNELGADWRGAFETLRSHFAVSYVKDWKRGAGFVAFGEGEFSSMDFFRQLRKMNYHAPFSLHIEYKWHGDEPRSRERLVKAMKSDRAMLNRWWNEA